jgi:dihydroorotate dehydrogenase electron transfer subunit
MNAVPQPAPDATSHPPVLPAASPACYADAAACRTARIVRHARIADDTWRLRLECPAIAAAARPGQFAMVRIPGRHDPLLARPLAVYECAADDHDEPHGRPTPQAGPPPRRDLRFADFIYAVHGRFTTALKDMPVGAELLLWGPLGNGFREPAAPHLVLVAGGIGQTALLALGRRFLAGAGAGAAPRRVTACWGARRAGLFGGLEDYRASGFDVHLATLDGSAGLRGNVVDLLEARLAGVAAETVHVACCGPDAMMAAVSRWTGERGIPCEVSLETPMACGIGICFTCVARVRDDAGGWDYRRTCVEGPVFDATRIVW